jgi:hypothetical protein
MVRDRVVASGLADAAYALLDDPSRWTQCWMLTSAWIHKPPM